MQVSSHGFQNTISILGLGYRLESCFCCQEERCQCAHCQSQTAVKRVLRLAARPCRELTVSEIGPNLFMQSLQSSGKPALAIPRSWVISSPEQIWVAEVHLHRPAWFLHRGPLPYHPACSSTPHVSPHCICIDQMLTVVAPDSVDCCKAAACSLRLSETGTGAL